MIKDLEKGDVAMTLYKFFLKSSEMKPQKSSKVSLKQVDKWLDDLSLASGDDARITVLTKCTKQFTADDFLVFIRLIKKDLRINAGSKQVYVNLFIALCWCILEVGLFIIQKPSTNVISRIMFFIFVREGI